MQKTILMKKSAIPYLLLCFVIVILSSCVTKKKYLEVENARKNCEQENTALKNQNIDLTTQVNEMQSKLLSLGSQNAQMARDSAATGQELRNLKDQYNRLNKSYEDLNNTLSKNTQMSSAEMQRLLAELQKSKEDLQLKEDLLKKTERELDGQKTSLDDLSAKLSEKEKRLNELQSILDRKDSIVKALKDKVMAALTGFVGKGLSVEMKNGKVYVHMDEKLLFATGSFEVAPNGVEALKNLAKVLETNPDINITVEGHTDNVAYKSGSGPINDNWDLSAMRATAVVKILLKNSKVSPARLMAAGRSQYWPLDAANTPEARSKNRRTEIILTPKLDELFKILESN
jgi:chemotaxis protein MotB